MFFIWLLLNRYKTQRISNHIEARNNIATRLRISLLYLPFYFKVLVSNKSSPYAILTFTVDEMGSHGVLNLLYLKMFITGLMMIVLRSKHVAIMWYECVYT